MKSLENTKKLKPIFILLFLGVLLLTTTQCNTSSDLIKVGVFEINATPPIGSPVAYAKTRSIADSLSAMGIVILSDEKPVVLCAVDWIGIANEGQDAWRESLAKAAGTTIDRVSVHTIHQHDGCLCDFTTEDILNEYGLGGWRFDTLFLRNTIRSVAIAVRNAIQTAQPITHLGFGKAKVKKVASNRRILGEDGKVMITRWSSTKDSAAIAAPEGLIDPWLKCVSFWNDDQPIAVLNYYATHPMSHYGKGDVSSDFPGIARDAREKQLRIPHIYFTGASGNITAGKYNDGSPERRAVLADRLENAMRVAWEQTKKTPISKSDLEWKNVEVQLPLAKHLVEEEFTARLSEEGLDSLSKFVAARHLAWLRRTKSGHKINVSALKLSNVWLLNLPGETFIEYQLAAQKMKPGNHVCTAAYEEYGPGYVCTEIAYSQGGYESSDGASRVSPEIEQVLLTAIGQVLK
jgi:hypothetical protein